MFLFCFVIIGVLCSFTIVLLLKKELIAFDFIVSLSVFCVSSSPYVDLWYVIVSFSGYTHLLFVA